MWTGFVAALGEWGTGHVGRLATGVLGGEGAGRRLGTAPGYSGGVYPGWPGHVRPNPQGVYPCPRPRDRTVMRVRHPVRVSGSIPRLVGGVINELGAPRWLSGAEPETPHTGSSDKSLPEPTGSHPTTNANHALDTVAGRYDHATEGRRTCSGALLGTEWMEHREMKFRRFNCHDPHHGEIRSVISYRSTTELSPSHCRHRFSFMDVAPGALAFINHWASPPPPIFSDVETYCPSLMSTRFASAESMAQRYPVVAFSGRRSVTSSPTGNSTVRPLSAAVKLEDILTSFGDEMTRETRTDRSVARTAAASHELLRQRRDRLQRPRRNL
jgi:hypothetical protein